MGAEKRTPSEIGRELNGLIRLPFGDKLSRSLHVIQDALRYGRPVIASSFGKDSIVLIHLVHSIDDSIPIVFTNTGVNFRETLKYMGEMKQLWGLKIYELRPEKTFWQIVEEWGYPKWARNSKTGDKREPKCCAILKHDPMNRFIKKEKPNIVFVGLLGDEGRQRRMNYINKGGPIYEAVADKVMKCIPLIWWTQEDIWHYHDINNIPRNPVYEKYGIVRTGCITCTGHKGWQEQLNKTFPKLYQKIQHDLGQNLITEYLHFTDQKDFPC